MYTYYMICFVIAMEKEAAPIIARTVVEKDYSVCGRRVVLGKLLNSNVAVVVCGVGKVNAACGAQYAIDCLQPSVIVNVGVAGGLNSSMQVGKIYGVESAVQYDFDLAQLNGTAIGTLDEYDINYLPLSTDGRYPLKKLGTGDRFNDSAADFELLTKTLGADIRDMELGAIVQTCKHAGVKCAAYKIISDLAGSGSTTEQFLKNLAVCFNTLENELENMVNGIKAAVNG